MAILAGLAMQLRITSCSYEKCTDYHARKRLPHARFFVEFSHLEHLLDSKKKHRHRRQWQPVGMTGLTGLSFETSPVAERAMVPWSDFYRNCDVQAVAIIGCTQGAAGRKAPILEED